MIKPTVGRIVHYHPDPFDNIAPGIPGGAPLAAIIATVWSDTCVNLAVFDANGVSCSRTSVLLWQEGNARPSNSFCEWMPYQKQVAAGEIPPVLHAT